LTGIVVIGKDNHYDGPEVIFMNRKKNALPAVANGFHVFQDPGTYTVTLNIVDDSGVTATTSDIKIYNLSQQPYIIPTQPLPVLPPHIPQI